MAATVRPVEARTPPRSLPRKRGERGTGSTDGTARTEPCGKDRVGVCGNVVVLHVALVHTVDNGSVRAMAAAACLSVREQPWMRTSPPDQRLRQHQRVHDRRDQ